MSKRLISLFCAITMIFSVLTGMNIINVNAASEPAIIGKAVYDAENKEASITISYEGLNTIKGLQVAIPVDATVFEEPTVNEEDGSVSGVEMAESFKFSSMNYVDGEVIVAFLATSKPQYVVASEGDVLTLKLKVKDPSKLPVELELRRVKLTDSKDGVDTTYGTEDLNPDKVIPVTNPEVVDPTATEKPTPRPTFDNTNKPTEIPIKTEEPTQEPTPVPETNVSGVATYDEETKEAKIEISYAGLNLIKGLQVAIPVDATVFEEPTVNEEDGSVSGVEMGEPFKLSSMNYTDGEVIVAFLATSKPQYVNSSAERILTLTLKVKDPSKLPVELKLRRIKLTDSKDGVDTTYGTEDLNPDKVIAVVNPVVKGPDVVIPEPEVVSKIYLSESVADDVKEEIKQSEAGDYTLEVTVNGGEDTVYGEDYVAVYDKKELTVDEYNNMLNGYGKDEDGEYISISDVIDTLYYNVYNEDVTGITTVVKDWTAGEIVGEGNATAEPDVEKVTVTVKDSSNGTIKASYTDKDGSKVEISEGESKEVEVGTSVTFTAKADEGYEFDKWTGINSSNTSVTIKVDKDCSVTGKFVKEEDNDNDGSDSDSDSGSSSESGSGSTGPIAGGNNTGTGVPGPGSQSGVNFQDLGSVQWAVPAINTLVNLGIINGRSDTIFDPNANVTRAEFTKMVCIAFSVAATPNTQQKFTDVAPTDWFYGYVQAAADRGFVNGVTDTEFDPNATITREQMAAILYRAAQSTGGLALLKQGTAKVFADEYLIDEYAKIPVSTLSGSGVINGVTDTTFEPDSTATRAQSAAIIYQYFKAVGVA